MLKIVQSKSTVAAIKQESRLIICHKNKNKKKTIENRFF
jgi:hypothetical protein